MPAKKTSSARSMAALAAACQSPEGPLTSLACEGLLALLGSLDADSRARALGALSDKSPRLVYPGKRLADSTPPCELTAVSPRGLAFSDDGDTRLTDGCGTVVYGDNLSVMRQLLTEKETGTLRCADGTPGARLIYMDPPFATGRDFRFSDGRSAYTDRVTGSEFAEFLRLRIEAARDLLTPDGSLYIHLDPHAAHTAKVLADEIFGEKCFRGEIVWKRSTAKGSSSRSYGAMHDTILYYSRNPSGWLWNRQFTAYSETHKAKFYRFDDNDGRGLYGLDNLQKPEAGRGYQYSYDGYQPPAKGWYVTEATMQRLDVEGRIHKPADKDRRLRLKRYLNEAKGVPLQDMWDDIPPVQRPRYPTQKPTPLLERIIGVSSNPGDVVLDPFNGAGTTLTAAVGMGRRGLAIDLSVESIRATITFLPEVNIVADSNLSAALTLALSASHNTATRPGVDVSAA